VIIYIALTAVIIALVVERYFYAKDMNGQVNDFMKALIARTPQDFIHMKTVEDKAPTPFKEKDEIPIEELSDSAWMEAIKQEAYGDTKETSKH